MTQELLFHEVAELFPLMVGPEYEELKEDIRANGQHVPIAIYQGSILDGRNRYQVCQELGIEPICKEWDGQGGLVEFVISLNMRRRHLSSDQRACIAAEAGKLMEQFKARAKERKQEGSSKGGTESGKTRRGETKVQENFPEPSSESAPQSRDRIAELMETNPRYVSDATRLQKEDPEAFKEVKAGKKKLHRVMKEKKNQKTGGEGVTDNKEVLEERPKSNGREEQSITAILKWASRRKRVCKEDVAAEFGIKPSQAQWYLHLAEGSRGYLVESWESGGFHVKRAVHFCLRDCTGDQPDFKGLMKKLYDMASWAKKIDDDAASSACWERKERSHFLTEVMRIVGPLAHG
jgi:hypothetical protein